MQIIPYRTGERVTKIGLQMTKNRQFALRAILALMMSDKETYKIERNSHTRQAFSHWIISG